MYLPERAQPASASRPEYRVPLLLAASVTVPIATFVCLRLAHFPARLTILLCGALTVLFGTWATVRAIVVTRRRRRAEPDAPWVPLLLGGIVGVGMTLFGGFIAFASTVMFTRGRQLRRRGQPLLPAVRAGDAWAQAPLEVTVDAAIRDEVAARWRDNGRTEHASVAAFARLTLDLMALGAPPALVRDANADAIDEIRHTELCFSLARAIDGKSEEPAPFPEAQRARTLPSHRALALAKLAVDSLVDGALNEGLSARVVARLARRCDEPTIQALLREIAADEGRHAAHGWDVVEWCLAEGKEPVARALLGATRALPATLKSAPTGIAATGAWERWGLFGRALEAEEYQKTLAYTVTRVRALLSVAHAMPAESRA